MPGVEIERKWLVAEAPADALAADSDLIEQGYLTIGTDGGETRLRRRGERCFLTVKSGAGMKRAEHEVELSIAQFEALWPATEGARLVKRRHLVRAEDGHLIELDVYEGELSGLLVAEVEFDDPWGAESFAAPYWFGPEVTDDPAYKNQRLAVARGFGFGEPPAPTSR
jgi:CYTH domain-containing protein